MSVNAGGRGCRAPLGTLENSAYDYDKLKLINYAPPFQGAYDARR